MKTARAHPARYPKALIAAALALVALAILCYLLRPLGIIRGPYMLFFVRHPMLVWLPLFTSLATFAVGCAVVALRGGFRSPPKPSRAARSRASRNGAQGRGRRSRFPAISRLRDLGFADSGPLAWPATSAAVVGTLTLLFSGALSAAFTGRAIYEHSDFSALSTSQLTGGEVRVKPYEVASRQLENSLNSPTERISNLHIAKVDGKLRWTAAKDPDGTFRVITKKTAGVMSVDGESSSPRVAQGGPRYEESFKIGPGMKWADGIKWRVEKDYCYTCDIAEMTAVPTTDGPVVIAPYVRYEGGWFVRRPVFGGVYLVHADGRIENLSPKEAAAHPLVAPSGRMYPEKLARRTADAYKYKRGILNRMFTHTEQLEVADTDQNKQPYLQDFERLGLQWVTTMKPSGQTFTTAAVIATDSTSGKNRVYIVPKRLSLIGNEKATDIVRGESIPGITFADEGAGDAGGKFRVVEPRQVFPGGRLQFLVTIVPNSSNRSTMSVVVDAERQEVVAKFPASAAGDADLISYLDSGKLETQGSLDAPGDGKAGGKAGPLPKGRGAGATLRRLLQQNLEEQRLAGKRFAEARSQKRDLKAQERDLRRLLGAAGRSGPQSERGVR